MLDYRKLEMKPCDSQLPSQFERFNKNWSDHETKLLSGIFGSYSNEGVRPAAVFFDDLVDLAHDANGFTDGDDDLLVMVNVFFRK